MPTLQTDPAPARLAAVDAQCFAQPWDAAAYARLRANPALVAWLVEEPPGEAQGLLVFQRVGDEAEVYRIAVRPAARGRGLGRWLLQRLLALAGPGGLRRVHLEVRAGNTAARRLYVRAGFAQVGRRPGYYRDPPEDALLYAWPPDPPPC